MFQQSESGYDLLSDSIHRPETDYKTFKSFQTSRKIGFDNLLSPSHSSVSPPLKPYANDNNAPSTPGTHYQCTHYYRGLNMDYLGKH